MIINEYRLRQIIKEELLNEGKSKMIREIAKLLFKKRVCGTMTENEIFDMIKKDVKEDSGALPKWLEIAKGAKNIIIGAAGAAFAGYSAYKALQRDKQNKDDFINRRAFSTFKNPGYKKREQTVVNKKPQQQNGNN